MPIFSEPLYSSRPRRLVFVAALLGTPAVLLLLLRLVPQLDLLFMSVSFHLVVVSAIAACALAVAVFAAVAAARAHEPSLVFLALGCLAVGTAMLAHGLTTPGVAGMPVNLWVARLPHLAIAGFAVGLAAALIRPGLAPVRFVGAHPWASILVPGGVMVACVAAIYVSPTSGLGSRALPAESVAFDVLALCSGATLVIAGAIHWRRWRLGGDKVQLALLFAAWMAVQAELSLHFGRFWQLSWWDYHALLLVGFGAAVYAVVVASLRAREHRNDLEAVFRKDLLSHIERGYPEALQALVAATEARDSYTRGHSRRVTELSVSLGQRLGLRTDALRRLAWGAELHDIGKIGVPDFILNKEGPLTPEERALIEQHPVIGWEIARQARSLGVVLEVIRSHHERIDGRGYPDGLSGDAIPMSARIVAVADVWDALTSTRSYRPAWPSDRALDLMSEGRGTQFDAQCLDAFISVMAERGATAPSVGG
jgi:putative nucleotidyltransferase with HDIG domain